MLTAALRRFGRLGFVATLLLVLTAIALPTQGEACSHGGVASGSTAPELAAGAQSDAAPAEPCKAGSCEDCGGACAHSCGHMHAVGVMAGSPTPLAPIAISVSLTGLTASALDPTPLSGLERPPRA